MSNTRCQALSWLLLPMTAVVLAAVKGVFTNETLLLYLWTAAVILTHVHYGVSVVRGNTHVKNVKYNINEAINNKNVEGEQK